MQLLSRQLYNFDTAVAKEEERLGGLRDRLHIFPYTYYLVGRPGPIVRRLLAVMVGITLLVLPLATLLVLQMRFLAYQDQAVTWAQRIAVWLDVALVITLWPVIMDRGDSWRDYLHRLASCLGLRLPRWGAEAFHSPDGRRPQSDNLGIRPILHLHVRRPGTCSRR